MVIKTIKNIFFGLAGFAFVVAMGYFFFYEREAPNAIDEYYASNVQEQLAESIATAEAELKPLSLALPVTQKGLQRSNLPTTTYPYFIFKNGGIEHWSSNAYVPSYADLDTNKPLSFLETANRKFVVVKNKLEVANYEAFTLIPIYSDAISRLNGYNPTIFSLQPASLSKQTAKETYKNILSPGGEVLFSVEPPTTQNALQPLLPDTTLKLFGICILFLSIAVLIQIGQCIRRHRFGRAFILLTLFLIAARWLLLVNNVPLINFHSIVFDPFPFSASRWNISLGDRLINAVLWVIILGFLAVYFYRSSIYYRISKSREIIHSFYAVCCVVFITTITYVLQAELKNLLFESGDSLDYALSVSFDTSKLAILAYYLLLSVVFFLSSHCCIYLFSRMLTTKTTGILHWLYGLILSIIVISIIDELRWIYLLVGIYFLTVYYFGLSRNFYVFRFRTSLYFSLAAFVFALFSVGVLSGFNDQKELLLKQKFAHSFFTDKDPSAEIVLENAFEQIEKDGVIRSEIQRSVLARERVVQHIRENYLKDFLNGYRSEIYVFDSLGNNLDILSDSKPLSAFKSKISYPSADAGALATHFGFCEITAPDGSLKGSVVIELQKLNDVVPSNGYTDKTNGLIKQNPDFENYSYALFDAANQLIYSHGAYNYANSWDKNDPKQNELFTKEIVHNDFQHFAVRAKDGRIIIVSSPNDTLFTAWANLSFLFFLSVIAVSLVLIFYGFIYRYKRKTQMNFTTRIQLYLNTAFILPLLLVLLITISVVGTTLKRNQENGFIKNTSNIASTIELLTQDWKSGKMTTQFYEQEIAKVSSNAKIDLTLYDAKGMLFFTTAPVGNSKVFSNYLSPEAYNVLMSANENKFTATEGLGNLEFDATYAAIRKNNAAGKIILRIPYLDSQLMLTKQLTEVVSFILMIFIVLFVILILASYFVSQQLTTPLRAITSHIRKTNLDKLNEPLPNIDSGDEMGVLVRAYNKMLRKLEESKLALSTSEKQTAWREMAKQVAHEIKNPLTPMKLSIQQLQRTLPTDSPKTRNRIERALNSLNEQIDNISEIANSFSEFAKMPVPRSEDFDLVKVIQNTIDLYSTNKNMDIKFNISEPSMFVRGDRQLMSRMLTNLIINGLQSVPIHKRPEIVINLNRNNEDNFAIVEVKDNGVGIPEEIREKVFMPSFSTKVGGSGLGLALSKRGIEHAGGNIWFETVVNEGTSFFVDLPIVKG